MCNERISQCARCGYSRHISWTQCQAQLSAQVTAIETLEEPPHPSACEHLRRPEVAIWLRPQACPTENEGCGAIRKKLEQERERKDSGVSGMGEEDASEATSIRSSEEADSTWEDCAVSDESAPTNEINGNNRPNRFRNFVFHPRGDRWKPMGPNIKYAPDFVEAGPREMRPNYRNMGFSYGIHIGPTIRSTEHPGSDIVRRARSRYLFNSKTSIIPPLEIRDSIEPDETYLLIKGYNNIPEVRAQWAAKKRRNPGQERPVMTMAAVVEELFGRQQHSKEEEGEEEDGEK